MLNVGRTMFVKSIFYKYSVMIDIDIFVIALDFMKSYIIADVPGFYRLKTFVSF